MEKEIKIAIIGLGYVGLPLAVEFARKYHVIGFDLKEDRIAKLQQGVDETLECSAAELDLAQFLTFTAKAEDIEAANVYVLTVPTPIDEAKNPDLRPLQSASRIVAKNLRKGDVVIYESTVFPGCTEEICVPVLEEVSGLRFNEDFFCGYSPERINPGDKKHRLPDIVKVTSGSTPAIANFVDELYASIITAGTHKASSLKVAEAAKVIENTQRDLNIALVNELSLIFEKVGIDTLEVLEAAGTKWNFMPFRPGLVGGHCIGVDPYYLTHKAQSLGYHPEVILAGRRINDNMAHYVASSFVKAMLKKRIQVSGARILIAGLTFKENCPDLRNTKIVELIRELEEYGAEIFVWDPWVDCKEAQERYQISVSNTLPTDKFDACCLAVGHQQFIDLGAVGFHDLLASNSVFCDLKANFPKESSDLRL